MALDFPVWSSLPAQSGSSSSETKPENVIQEHTGSALTTNEHLVFGTKCSTSPSQTPEACLLLFAWGVLERKTFLVN